MNEYFNEIFVWEELATKKKVIKIIKVRLKLKELNNK